MLCEFRARLVEGSAEGLLLEALLAACRARGYLKVRGRQRTDSTHVLGALRLLSRVQLVAETLRQALNAIPPAWLQANAPADWFDRYGRRVEEYRLPRGQGARHAYAQLVGADGMHLLEAVATPTAPPEVRGLPAIRILRRIWLQQFVVGDGDILLRAPGELPRPATNCARPSRRRRATVANERTPGWATKFI